MLAVFPVLLYGSLKRPFIAVSLWLWVSMFNPSGWVHGEVASQIRFNLIFSVIAIASIFFNKNRIKTKNEKNLLTFLVSFFLIWTIITTLNTIGDPEIAWEYCWRFTKVVSLYYCAIFLLTRKLHIDFFIWVLIVSVGFFAFVESLKFFVSLGRHHIRGMDGHILGDNNSLALAIDMCIPLVIYIVGQTKVKILRWTLSGLVFLMILCVIGTHSRGGLLGLIVIGIYFFNTSERKIGALFIIGLVLLILSNFVTEQWANRMDTISNVGQDSSFMGRVVAWKISTLIAIDNPITGGGIKALEDFPIWLKYVHQIDRLHMIQTPPPDLIRAHAAHSIYFQALGDQGFFGLFLMVSILLTAYLKTSKLERKAREITSDWILSLSKMLKISIVVYATAGAALSMVYFDLIFAIYAMVRVLELKTDELFE